MAKPTEEDVPVDTHVANSRPINEDTEPGVDENTTGAGLNGEFVGRVQGQDDGYAGETGAGRRAAYEADSSEGSES